MKNTRKYWTGEKNKAWKGDRVKYRALHYWVEQWKGKPKKCEKCGTKKAKKYEWANVSGKYKRTLSDWIRLCTGCHLKMDFTEERRAEIQIGRASCRERV